MCLIVCYVCSGACRHQEEESAPLELESRAVGSCLHDAGAGNWGTKLGSLEDQRGSISLAPLSCIVIIQNSGVHCDMFIYVY